MSPPGRGDPLARRVSGPRVGTSSSSGAVVRRDLVLAALDEVLLLPEFAPPPAIAAVAASLGRVEQGPERVVEQIEADPEVAELVIKLAASPAYLSAVPVRSIVDAVHWLGARALWDLYLEAALSRALFQRLGSDMVGAMQRHAVAAAHVCRLLAQRAGGPAEAAFALGLLHDVGPAFAYLALSRIQGGAPRGEPTRVWQELLELGADATARVCRAWRVPPGISIPLTWHHRRAPIRDRDVALLFMADELSRDLGRGHPSLLPRDRRVEGRTRARGVLGILPNQITAIRFEADRLLDKLG